MVVLHVKSSSPETEEEMEFLYECVATSAVADVAATLAATAGLQARVLSLCRRLRERCAAGDELERALSEAEAYASKQYPDDKHDSIQLWWAGKELAMDKKLCDYVGVNDKTKIVIRLRQEPDEP